MAAAVLIPLFVVLIGGLMFVGWRSRPPLEIPPRRWPVYELSPAERRLRIRLRLIGLAAYLAGIGAFAALQGTRLRTAGWVLLGVGTSTYLATWITRIVIGVRRAREVR